MENIDRQQISKIIEILKKDATPEDPTQRLQLANALEKADIIPKLYQAAYVESMYLRLKDVKTLEELKEKFKFIDEYCISLTLENKAYDAIKALLQKAHDRQDEICDFADSTLPNTIKGRCQYENHIENNEDTVELTEEEQEKFDKIYEEKGHVEAWEHFEDKINPDNQTLQLILSWGQDETKVSKDDGEYVCDGCMEEIRDNSEGGLSCDMESVED